jgi:bifunctional non-homologous end joining protein LigD
MKECRWVKPTAIAEIEVAEWTADDRLRHASFVGLRDDKKAREVVKESRD